MDSPDSVPPAINETNPAAGGDPATGEDNETNLEMPQTELESLSSIPSSAPATPKTEKPNKGDNPLKTIT